jgi:hypothetical protein
MAPGRFGGWARRSRVPLIRSQGCTYPNLPKACFETAATTPSFAFLPFLEPAMVETKQHSEMRRPTSQGQVPQCRRPSVPQSRRATGESGHPPCSPVARAARMTRKAGYVGCVQLLSR